MVVKPIEIKEQVYFKEYKNIIRLCISEGDVLPVLLESISVPEKYDFTEDEIERMKISEEASSNRQQLIMDLEEKLNNVSFDNVKDLDEQYNTIHNEELMSFIGRHPEYQKLLK